MPVFLATVNLPLYNIDVTLPPYTFTKQSEDKIETTMASQGPSNQKTTEGAKQDVAKGQQAGATAGEKRDEKVVEPNTEPSTEPGPKILPTHYRGLPKNWEKNRQRKYFPCRVRAILGTGRLYSTPPCVPAMY